MTEFHLRWHHTMLAILHACAVLCVVVFSGACSRSGNQGGASDRGSSTDQATADITGVEIDTAVGVERVRGRLAGELAQSLEDYAAGNAQEFFDLVHGPLWLGPTRDRPCKGDPACNTETVKVSVRAIHDANTFDISRPDALPRYGVVIVKLRNQGKHVEAMYDLKPGPWETYIVVRPVSDSTGKVVGREQRLVDLYVGQPKRLEIRESFGAFYKCHDGPTWVIAYADFRGCDRFPPGTEARQPATGAATAPVVTSRAHVWVTCAQGCCTSEYPLLQSDTTRAQKGGR